MNGILDEIRIAAWGVWRRRWLALGVAWGLALAGWLVLSLIPNRYQSSARIYVSMQSILPAKMGISAAEQQADIDRVRTTLLSAENLEKVVRSTDLSLQATTPQDVGAAIGRLQQGIEVKQQGDNLFTITATASAGGLSNAQNAKLARDVVAKLIDLFVEENIAGNRDETSSTLRFLDAQLKQREEQLQDAEARRAAFEQKYLGLLPGSGSIGQRMDQARSELNQVEGDLAAAQSAVAAMSGQMASTPATIAAPSAGVASVGGARARVAQLQNQLAEYQGRGLTDQHPDVVATRSEIGRLRGAAASESVGGGGAGTTANPLYVTLRAMLAEKQATASALAARKAQLASDLARFSAKQAEEPGVAAEQARLSRDYDVLKAQYDKLLADREDVKLRSDVQTETDPVQFRVIDPPGISPVPVAPNRPLLLTAVLVMAALGGIAAAFVQSRLKTGFVTAGGLEAASGLPVIGTVSEIVSASQKAVRRSQLKWFGGTAGALAGAWALLMVVEFVRRGMTA